MSMIKTSDGIIPLESLSKEEKSRVWNIMADRIGEAVTDYVNRHPEDIEAVAAALEWAREHPW